MESQRGDRERIQEIKQGREGLDPLSIRELLLVCFGGYFGG